MKRLPIGTFFDDLADAIANPSPSRPLRDSVGRQGRKVCDALSVVPPWARTVPGATRDLFGICAPYWDASGISPPSSVPPFTGGQCATGYTFRWQQRVNTGGSTFGWSTTIATVGTGPLSVGRANSDPLPTPPTGRFANNAGLFDGNGVRRVVLALGITDDPNGWRFVSMTRNDGQPDNCGNPPGVLTPGPNPAPNPPVLPVDEQPVDDPVSGPLLPIPDLPSIPGLPSIPWRNPFAPGDPLTGIPGDPGTPGDPVDTTGPGDAAEGDADPGAELVALKLTLVETPPFSQPLQNDVFRSVAFVYMGTVAGLDQDPSGALVRDGQLVYAERSGLTKWRVAANVGYTVRVTPFYQEVN